MLPVGKLETVTLKNCQTLNYNGSFLSVTMQSFPSGNNKTFFINFEIFLSTNYEIKGISEILLKLTTFEKTIYRLSSLYVCLHRHYVI